jgi:hypothetical protein
MSNEETQETKVNENVVDSKPKASKSPSTKTTDNGTIGAALPNTNEPVVKSEEKEELVALYSPNNRFWDDIGRLTTGYNFVAKKDAEAWLTQPGIRKAMPAEVKANMPSGDDN